MLTRADRAFTLFDNDGAVMTVGDWLGACFSRLRVMCQPRPLFLPLGDHAVTRTWRGDLIFLSNRDLGMTPYIAMDGVWEPAVERVLWRILRRGMVAVELGANVGYHTLGMARSVGPAGRIHAFEANPAISVLLGVTLREAGFMDRVKLHNAAVCDRPGRVELRVDPLHSGSGHLAWHGSQAEYSQRFEVEAVRLDDVLRDIPEIDLLRMDIEGSEGLALDGARELVRRSPRLHIVTEWDPIQMRVRSDPADVARWLTAEGFKARLIKGLTPRPVDMRELATLPLSNLLLARA